jgi:hydrogenase nickel incorporation protein HypA/HybF
MHEFSTMQHIVEVVLSETQKHKPIKITCVNLEIGELTFLGIEQLRFAFQVLTKDSLLKNAELKIESVKPIIKCPSCNYRGDTKYEDKPHLHFMIPLLKCPLCGEDIEIVRGRECTVTSVQMETKS